MKRIIPIFLLLCSSVFIGCKHDIVYSQFHPIPDSDRTIVSSEKWHVDSVLHFDYRIQDTIQDYRILLYVRHTERYPYQNMWLFVENNHRRDTIEFYMADDHGRWLGDKQHGFIEMPVLFEESIHFPDTGVYHLSVQQGMRDTLLRGVVDIGVEIRRNGE